MVSCHHGSRMYIFSVAFDVANAADWYYVDADTDDSAWLSITRLCLKQNSMARILVESQQM